MISILTLSFSDRVDSIDESSLPERGFYMGTLPTSIVNQVLLPDNKHTPTLEYFDW